MGSTLQGKMANHIEVDTYPIAGVNWGSSNLQASLIDSSGKIIDSYQSTQGIAGIDHQELESVILALTEKWPEAKHWYFSGMVGSPAGWCDVGYVDCPIPVDQLGLVEVDHSFGNSIHMSIVKGLCVREPHQDVMRGEEVELLAMTLDYPELLVGEHVVGLPGTHTKWVCLHDGQVVDFFTAMGSEIFDHLSKNGLLKGLLSGEGEANGQFIAGLETAITSPAGLTRSLFGIRAKVMLGQMKKSDGAAYARGLLVGHELIDLQQIFPQIKEQAECCLVGNAGLCRLYQVAIEKYLELKASRLALKESSAAVYQALHCKPGGSNPR